MGVKACGICCGLFSLFSLVFLTTISQILASGSRLIEIKDADRAGAITNCYVGLGVYGVFLALSVGCFCYGSVARGKNLENTPLMTTDI